MTKLHIELSVIDRGENLVRRKRIYEALYPQTKRGTAGAMSRWGTDATAESAVASFNKDTATKTGISERGIFQDIQIANDIAPAVKDIIRDTDLADRKADLLSISRLSPDHQMQVAQKIKLQILQFGHSTKTPPQIAPAQYE